MYGKKQEKEDEDFDDIIIDMNKMNQDIKS